MYNRIWSIIFLLTMAGRPSQENDSLFSEEELDEIINKASCYQKRSSDELKHLGCEIDLIENFCDHVQCEPVNCDENSEEKVDGISGHGCCAACIRSLPFNAPCTPGSLLEQCQNGLSCSLSKYRCDLPRQMYKMECLKEYHNRNLMKINRKSFYIKDPSTENVVGLQYLSNMVMPSCSSVDGKYDIKQKTPSKGYCVNTENGAALFGVADRSHISKLTCRCSEAMHNLFKSGNPTDVLQDIFVDTHIRCSSSGNFAKLSCVNETCLCLDEATGQVKTHVLDYEYDDLSLYDENGEELIDNSRLHLVRFPSVVIYGALATLDCFDEIRGRTHGKNADDYYQESCQKEMRRIAILEEHFRKKGTIVIHNSAHPCGFDDRYDRKQCKDDGCKCSHPEGESVKSYGIDKSRMSQMDCRCALEEYFTNVEKKSFDKVTCSQEGNFANVQCANIQSDFQTCQCFDRNGMAISERFSCEVQALANMGLTDLQTICNVMAQTISSQTVRNVKDELYFNNTNHWYYIDKKPTKNNILCPPKMSI